MKPISLTGMTQGARKRAAWDAAIQEWDAACRDGNHRVTEFWLAARARYRIGEYLRPCLGCFYCNPRYCRTIRAHIMQPWGWRLDCASTHVPIADGTPCIPLHWYEDEWGGEGVHKIRIGTTRLLIEAQYIFTDHERICDGSGVLPARQRPRPCTGCERCSPRIRRALAVTRSEYDEPIEVDGPCDGRGMVPASEPTP